MRVALIATLVVAAACKREPDEAYIDSANLWIDEARGARGVDVANGQWHAWVSFGHAENAGVLPAKIQVELVVGSVRIGTNRYDAKCEGKATLDPAKIVRISEHPPKYHADVVLQPTGVCPRVEPGHYLSVRVDVNRKSVPEIIIPKSVGGDGLVHSFLAPADELVLAGGGKPAPPADDAGELVAYAKLIPPPNTLTETQCPSDLPPVKLHARYELLVRATCADAGTFAANPKARSFLRGWNGSKPIRQRAELCDGNKTPPDGLPRPDEASLLVLRATKGSPAIAMGMQKGAGDKPEQKFQAGTADGELFVIDRRTKTLACAATYHATSSESFLAKAKGIVQADLDNDLGNRATSEINGTLTRLGAPHPENLDSLD